MNPFFRLSISILLFAFLHFSCQNSGKDDLPKILLITGGHCYDTTLVHKVFQALENYHAEIVSQPNANEFLGTGEIDEYSNVVFYDLWREIEDKHKPHYFALTERGIGLVFLHHSLVSNQNWEEFSEIIGGRYYNPEYTRDSTKHSGFKHDIDLDVEIMDSRHPVTRNMQNFKIHDEGYSNIYIKPGVTPLLLTSHPHCADTIAWAHQYNNSKIVYLLFGHGKTAWQNEKFKKLITNALEWTEK